LNCNQVTAAPAADYLLELESGYPDAHNKWNIRIC